MIDNNFDMDEILIQIINTTLDSFDITFCIIVNIATFLITKIISENIHLTTWNKRIILLIVIVIIGCIYIITGSQTKLILNSSILAPVFWSWIAKPILTKFGIEYTKLNN